MITNLQNTSEYLQRFGIKPSLQRLAVMDYLLTHRTHPTADEIYEALHPRIPTLSKTTVYNTLRRLGDEGAILVLNIDEKNQRFDGDTKPHAHFRCQRCGKLLDVPLATSADKLCCPTQEISIKQVSVQLSGFCSDCMAQASS